MKAFSTPSFIGGFMLGVLLVGIWVADDSFSSLLPQSSSLMLTESAKKLQNESGVVSVANQSAGNTVQIESLTVPPPGVWVAVREVNGNDLGNVLGAAYVSGPRTNFSVQLLRATEAGLTYAVELYRDDGGKTFDLENDSVYVDFATGSPVTTYFSTTN